MTVVKPTINPLVYNVTWTFGEEQSGRQMLLLWNLIQQWATTNDSVPQGKVEREGRSITVAMGMKRRLGSPKDASPLG